MVTRLRATVLTVSSIVVLGGCAGQLGGGERERAAAIDPGLVAALAGEPTRAVELATVTPEAEAEAETGDRRAQRRGRRGPANGRFVGAHLGAGVASTMLVQTATYAVANRIGHTGQGLGPVIGALVLGAFAPPLLNYSVQWAAGRAAAPGRDRVWPGWLVRQLVHLGIFAGAVAGGADFNNPNQLTAIVVGEAFANSGLATMTAELARRPQPLPSSSARLDPGAALGTGGFELVVPILEVEF